MFMIIDNFYRLIISLLGECQYECCPFGGRCALQGDAASRKAHDLTGDGSVSYTHLTLPTTPYV